MIIEKGYCLTITSWQGNFDNYKVIRHTFKTKEEAQAIASLLKHFRDCEQAFGNSRYDINRFGFDRCGNRKYFNVPAFVLYLEENDPDLLARLIAYSSNGDWDEFDDIGLYHDAVMDELIDTFVGYWNHGKNVRAVDCVDCCHIKETMKFDNVDVGWKCSL